MAVVQNPPPVKLIVALMTADPRLFQKASRELESRCGPIDAASPDVRDDHFVHYEKEMGPGLVKRIVSFERLIDPAQLPAIKVETNALERRLSESGRRSMNLDPGYMTRGNLVLASATPRPRRIYLGDGIYAELELIYESGRFKPLPWTYPDYRQPAVLAFLEQVREAYLRQLSE